MLSAELELLCMQRSGPSCEILAVPMPGAGVMGAEALAAAAASEQEMATREAAVEAAEAARNVIILTACKRLFSLGCVPHAGEYGQR